MGKEKSVITDRHRNDEQTKAILDRMDQQEVPAKLRNRRNAARHNYRRPVVAHITQPGGGTMQCSVAPRELSATGMSFLYRGFLHTGTSARLVLQHRNGGSEGVESTVAWCRHIVGPHHLIGVKFRMRLFPGLFAEVADDDADERVDPTKLKGSILLIDDQELDRMLFEHHVNTTSLKVKSVGNPKSALEMASKESFDVIVCDLNLGEQQSGEELIKKFLANGYNGTIVALTAENSPARLKTAQAAGAQHVILKPYDPQALLAMIGGMLGRANKADNEPIYSDIAGSPGADALVAHCIEKVRTLAVELHESVVKAELNPVRALCQALKGSGSGFGFPALTEAAKLAVTALDASTDVKKSLDELHRLESVCRRLARGKAPARK